MTKLMASKHRHGTRGLLAALTLSLAVVGCGGDDEKAAPQKSAATAASTPAGAPDPEAALAGAKGKFVAARGGARLAAKRGDKPGPFKPSLTIKPGDVVQIRTAVGKKPPSDAKLEVLVPLEAGKEIRVTAGGVAAKASARTTLKAGSGEVKLRNVRYVCFLVSTSYCPADLQEVADGRARVVLDPPEAENPPLILVADVVKG